MKLPATPLVCSDCGATFGALLPLDPELVRAQLAGTFLAGIAGMLPADLAGTLAPVLKTECGACFLRRIQRGSSEEARGEEVRDDQDEEGNPRRVQRRGIFRRGT